MAWERDLMDRDEIQNRKVLITYPTHPMFLWAYLAVALILAVLFSRFPLYVAEVSYSSDSLELASIAIALIVLSPILSFINLVIKKLNTGVIASEIELNYVEFFGIPIPIPRLRMREVKTLLAMNVGGALVPITTSAIFSYLLVNSPYKGMFVASAAIDVIVVAAVTYALSRPMPGVGIVVPAFIPPLIAAFVAIATSGFGVPAAAAAYIGGSLGSLLGADVIRLSRSYRNLTATVLSIGGAGVFDGVFMSGVLAFLLAI